MAHEDEELHHGVEDPLLPVDAGFHTSHKKKRVAWYRNRRVLLVGVGCLGVLGVLYAIVNAQVQRLAAAAIRDTKMSVDAMDLSHPENSSVALGIALTIQSSSVFGAQVDPSTMAIYYDDQRVGSFAAPKMAIQHGTNRPVFPNSTLTIENRTAWDAFAHEMITREQVAYVVKASLGIHVRLLGGLLHFHATDIPLEKTLTFKGMDGLHQMQIGAIDMSHSTQEQVVANIKACVKNPSLTTIRPVGRLCMQAYYETVATNTLVVHLETEGLAGIAVRSNERSHPFCAALNASGGMDYGYNLLEFKGNMLAIWPNAISELISRYLSGRPTPLMVASCEPNATSIDIYNGAMRNLVIPTVLPPQKEPVLGNMFFDSITLDAPDPVLENDQVILNTVVAVEAVSPLGPNSVLTVIDVQMNVNLSAHSHGKDVFLGELSTTHVDIKAGTLVETSNITVNCSTRLQFADQGRAFGQFVRDSVQQDEIELRLEGYVNVIALGALHKIRLGRLPINQSSVLQGMQNLNNVTIESFLLPGDGNVSAHGERMETKISIWNPSLFAVSIGKLDMQLSLGDQSAEVFGQLHGLMNLVPGQNHLEIDGQIEPKLDPRGEASKSIAEFFSKYLQGKDSKIAVTITGFQYANCVWLTTALRDLRINTIFPGVASGFELLSGIDMHQLDVVLEEKAINQRLFGESNTKMLVRTDLKANVKMPASIQIPLRIPNVSVKLSMENERSQPIGLLRSERENCTYNQSAGGSFRLNMSQFYPIDFPNDSERKGMAGFITDLLNKNGSIMMRLASDSGEWDQGAFPNIQTRMGILALSHIPIAGAPLIPAMDSFKHPPVKIMSVDIISGLPKSMVLLMSFAITNPSVVQTALGSLNLKVIFENAIMGVAKVKDFKLKCCGQSTILAGTFEFQPKSADLVTSQKFLSNFVSGYFTHGKPQQIAIKGSMQSTTLDILQPALAALTIPTNLPTLAHIFPNTPTLVTSSLLYTPSIFHLDRIPTALELRNPFSEAITITGVDLELYPCQYQSSVKGELVCTKYYSDPLARFSPAKFEPIFIPAQTDGCFSCCQGEYCDKKHKICPKGSVGQCMAASVESFFSAEAIATLFHTATTGLLMRVDGKIHTSIGQYATQLAYQQSGLLVTMAKAPLGFGAKLVLSPCPLDGVSSEPVTSMTKPSKSRRQSLPAAVERDMAMDRPLGAGESMSAKKKRRLEKEKQQLKLLSSYFSMIDKTELAVEITPPPSEEKKKTPVESDNQEQLKDKASHETERGAAQRTLAF